MQQEWNKVIIFTFTNKKTEFEDTKKQWILNVYDYKLCLCTVTNFILACLLTFPFHPNRLDVKSNDVETFLRLSRVKFSIGVRVIHVYIDGCLHAYAFLQYNILCIFVLPIFSVWKLYTWFTIFTTFLNNCFWKY